VTHILPTGAANDRHVAVYLRVSTNTQDVDRQVEGCHRVAAEHFPSIPVVEYREEGVSASKTNVFTRPESSRLLAAVATGTVAGIVVDAQDRLCRGDELDEWWPLAATLSASGVTLVSASEGEIHYRGLEAIMSQLRAVNAKVESANKANRAATKRATDAANGRWSAGSPPPGFSRREDGVLEPDEVAPLIIEAFDRYDRGASINQLVSFLLEQTDDSRWHRQRVSDMLVNPAYAGRILYRGETFEGQHAPLIDAQLFNRVQARRERGKQTNFRQTRVQPFPRAVLRCGDCGEPLMGHSDRRGNGWRDYECRPCRSRFLAEHLEIAYVCILTGMNHVLNGVDYQALSLRYPDPSITTDKEDLLPALRNELAQARTKMDRLLTLVEEGDAGAVERYDQRRADAETLQARIAELSRPEEDAQADLGRLAQILSDFASTADDDGQLDSPLVRAWRHASVEQRHSLVVATTHWVEARRAGSLDVQLIALREPLSVGLAMSSRHKPDSKALRTVGFAAGSGS